MNGENNLKIHNHVTATLVGLQELELTSLGKKKGYELTINL